MNIIFLDIDGVLATLRVHLALKNKGGLIDKWYYSGKHGTYFEVGYKPTTTGCG